jgi:carnitine O-acetyltransferase
MLDAAPTIPLIRRIMKTTFKRLSKNYPDLDAVSPDIVGVTNVFEECWSSESLLTTAQTLTELAKRHHQQFTGQYEMQAATISTGKKFLKQAGFAGPEFAQMALQLAGYRLFGKQVGTYEAALTRYFLHGRTETARPVSPESNAFVKAMDDDDVSRDQKRELLKRAALVHMDCAEQASQGQGVDRHFFGLSSMLKEGEEAPSLFSHPLFLRSKNWRLTTSSVIFCPGFGPVVDDGIGVGYLVSSDSTLFTCTSRRDNKYIGPFCKLLVNAMEEMADLVKPDD